MTSEMQSPPVHRRQVRFAALAALILFALMLPLNIALESAHAPRGIISLEMAGSPERIQMILTEWNSEGLAMARWLLALDFLFIPCYVVLLVNLARYCGRDRPGTREQQAIKLATLLFVVAGSADLIENAGLLVALNQPQEGLWSALAAALALLKFSGVVIGLGLLIVIRASRPRHPLHR